MALDVELLESKQFAKAAKLIGEQEAKMVLEKSDADLKEIVAQCEIQKQKAKDEVEANGNYKKASETIGDFKRGLREAVAPFEAKKKLALAALRSNEK